MKSLRTYRVLALILVLALTLASAASALSLPKGFRFSDKKPGKSFRAVVIDDNVSFYVAGGGKKTLNKGDVVTVKGKKGRTFARVVYGGEKGLVGAGHLMSTVGVSAYAAKDCWAYKYGSGKKIRITWGSKYYMVGRAADKKGRTWILCTDRKGKTFIYVRKGHLYR